MTHWDKRKKSVKLTTNAVCLLRGDDSTMRPRQPTLFSPESVRDFNFPFPSTRYQGSKRMLVDWIWENVSELQFGTVLDVFGGTGVVSYMFKNAGKQVVYNDQLRFNWYIGQALIENCNIQLPSSDVELILQTDKNVSYPDTIMLNFENIYYTDEENAWLDKVIYNIKHFLTNPYKQALALFALFQACIIKRPYNLFHRANLYMRTSNVERSFGNKVTWDTPFETHFRQFVLEANRAVFDNGQVNQALCLDALETPIGADLVYLDPPYLNQKGVGVNYQEFYHFLEGMSDYDAWKVKIDYKSKNRRLYSKKSLWDRRETIESGFEQVIYRHRKSILVVSYRDDGIPTKEYLMKLLSAHKKHVYEASAFKQYALAHKRSQELLLIAY